MSFITCKAKGEFIQQPRLNTMLGDVKPLVQTWLKFLSNMVRHCWGNTVSSIIYLEGEFQSFGL